MRQWVLLVSAAVLSGCVTQQTVPDAAKAAFASLAVELRMAECSVRGMPAYVPLEDMVLASDICVGLVNAAYVLSRDGGVNEQESMQAFASFRGSLQRAEELAYNYLSLMSASDRARLERVQANAKVAIELVESRVDVAERVKAAAEAAFAIYKVLNALKVI